MKKELTMKLNVTGTTKNDPSYKVEIDFDFDGVSNEQLQEWALANRIIVWQNSNRDLSINEFMALNGTTMKVKDIGAGRVKKAKKMTMEEMLSYIKTLPEDQKMAFIAQLND